MQSGAGVWPFQAQGSWTYHQQTNEVDARGVSMSQQGQSAFHFGGQVAPNGRMFQSNIEAPDSTGSYVAQRLVVVCQR